MIIDDILKKYGLKYEDLNSLERETLNSWLEIVNKGQINVGKIKSYIIAMRDSVEQELTKTGHNSKQDMFLKARLRNYMLLEAFLSTPEKARQALERTIAGVVGGKK